MQAIISQVEFYLNRAQAYFEVTLKQPEILLNQRGMAAGCADLSRWRLRFNPTLYQENREHFLIHTVGHEVAHLVAHALYGRVPPHGKAWQQIMLNVFELPPNRVHHYAIGSVQGRRVTYRCDCQTHALSIRRHNAIIRGQVYRCRRCQADLTLACDLPTQN
jgi:SprT protein